MLRSLFSSESPLDRYVPLIERIVRSLGLDPDRARVPLDAENCVAWTLSRGSAEVEIMVTADEDDGWYRVECPILFLPPENQEAFFRHLLELNGRISGVSLCLHRDTVRLCGARPLKGMDEEEASELLHRVSRTADGLDDELNARFGAPFWEERRSEEKIPED